MHNGVSIGDISILLLRPEMSLLRLSVAQKAYPGIKLLARDILHSFAALKATEHLSLAARILCGVALCSLFHTNYLWGNISK